MATLSLERVLSRISKYLATVLDEIRHRGSVVFEAYPGFGKTFLGLSVLKEFHSGLYVTRTIAEMMVVMNIGELMNLDVRPLYGRAQLCTKLPRDSVPELFYQLCRARRTMRLCEERVDSNLVAKLSTLRSPEEIRAVGAKLGICPYRAHLVASLSKRYIVTTYEFIAYHRGLRELERGIAVYDECHTILDLLDMYIQKVDRYELLSLAGNIRSYFPKLAYVLKSIAKRSENVEELLESLAKVVESDIDGAELLEDIATAYHSGRVYIDRATDSAYLLTKPLDLQIGKHKLFMTAYVPPFLLSRKSFIRVEDPPLRVSTIIDTSITSRYIERGEEFPQRLAEIIEQYIDREHATLVVLPSKKLCEEIEVLLLTKGYRIAPPHAIDRVGEGTIVVDAAGGIATEGLTPSKALRRVIVAGMPYPIPEPRLNLLAKIYGFDNVYTYIAILRTVQAVGRLMRWGGTAVLIDKRFALYRDRLPPWIEITEIR